MKSNLVVSYAAVLVASAICFVASGQTYTNLHSFVVSDGQQPRGQIALTGGRLYGTTINGGTNDQGTIFAVNIDGTGFTNLHHFNSSTLDGVHPYGGLVVSGNTLYGTASGGGNVGFGTLFKINTDGTGFTNFHSFAGTSDGATPYCDLLLLNGTVFGTTYSGGTGANGTVFSVSTNGSNFVVLHNFTATSSATNTDGAGPYCGLATADGILYGTAAGGGFYTRGVVFAVRTNGLGFTNLHNFSYSDGASPKTDLIVTNGSLYGAASFGGQYGYGSVFSLGTNGTTYTNLHDFKSSDGGFPQGGLVMSGDRVYGTASSGGNLGYGLVYGVRTNGGGYTDLHDFYLGNLNDNAQPEGLGLFSGWKLFGTTDGNGGAGVLFTVTLPSPQLAIAGAGTNVVVTWPGNAAGFTLQLTTNLAAPSWTTVTATPLLQNGQYTVTNSSVEPQSFYRLKQ